MITHMWDFESRTWRFFKNGREVHRDFSKDSYAGFDCEQCDGHAQGYMITDALWTVASRGQHSFMCLDCVEKNLDRRLVIDDFIDAPINRGIFGFTASDWVSRPGAQVEDLVSEQTDQPSHGCSHRRS